MPISFSFWASFAILDDFSNLYSKGLVFQSKKSFLWSCTSIISLFCDVFVVVPQGVIKKVENFETALNLAKRLKI